MTIATILVAATPEEVESVSGCPLSIFFELSDGIIVPLSGMAKENDSVVVTGQVPEKTANKIIKDMARTTIIKKQAYKFNWAFT